MSDDQKPGIRFDNKTQDSDKINIISENLAEMNGIMLFGNLERILKSLPDTNDWPFTEEESIESDRLSKARTKRIKTEVDSYDLSHLSILNIEKLFSQAIAKEGIDSDAFWGIMDKIKISHPDIIFQFVQENLLDFGAKFINGTQRWHSCSKSYFINIVTKFNPEFTHYLISLLNDNDIDIQRSTCFALASHNVKEAIPKILDMAKNHEWYYVKYDAITALGIFADESVILDLIELQKDHTFVHEDRTIAMVATQAIEEIRSRKI